MVKLDQKLQTMLRRCTNLPSPPAVASKIIDLSSCNTSGLADVADVVGLDPALSAKLLRMANSPLYAQQRKIENLRQAIILFGLEGTLNIALSFSLKQESNNDVSSGLDYHMYWRRSLASAVLCQEIGLRLPNCSKDSAFLAGLLQDIGMLALDKAKPDLYKDLGTKQKNHAQVCAHEQHIMGEDHSKVGAWLLSEWHLPEKIIGPISDSHCGLLNTYTSNQSDLSIAVVCACILADIFVSEDNEIADAMIKSVGLAEKISGISRDEFKVILDTVTSNYCDLANLFDIELENPSLIEYISDQAKEVLILRNLNKIKETESLQEAAQQLKSKTIELEEVSRRDSLTKLHNRRHFEEVILSEFENSKKFNWPLSVVFIDIDLFKNINDTYGHGVGDEMLCHSAKILKDCTRDSDTVSRFGGEEFIILLPGTAGPGVEVICNRIVTTFRNRTAEIKGGQLIHLTVSAGAVTYEGQDHFNNYEDLINAADATVYKAKENGRDQFFIYDHDEFVSTQLAVS